MSIFTQMPLKLYEAGASVGDCNIGDRFDRSTAHAMAWLSQLSYETDKKKITNVCSLSV
jgi:hypothetical protein